MRKSTSGFSCPICERSFTAARYLGRHMQAAHPEKVKRKKKNQGLSLNDAISVLKVKRDALNEVIELLEAMKA